MIKHYGFEYIALNPGASYRGLHVSLVNYGENVPQKSRHGKERDFDFAYTKANIN